MDKLIVRQGDVLIVQSDKSEGEEIKQKGRTVLAFGEVTGHAHAFYDNSAKLYQAPKIRHLEIVKTKGLLKHEEHTKISIPNGKYDLPRQVEWNDDLEPRIVAD
jgi:hypothetical protein